MSNYRNLDGIRTAFNKEIAELEAIAEAWAKVKFPTKKDGTPFAVLSKNIENARIHAESYAIQAGENKLSVTIWSKSCGYVTDSIDIFSLVEDMKDDDPRKAKTMNYMPKQTWLKQVYKFDLEDIKQAVFARQEYIDKLIDKRKHQLELLNNAYTTFKEAFKQAEQELSKIAERNEDSHLYYAVIETVKESYPYC